MPQIERGLVVVGAEPETHHIKVRGPVTITFEPEIITLNTPETETALRNWVQAVRENGIGILQELNQTEEHDTDHHDVLKNMSSTLVPLANLPDQEAVRFEMVQSGARELKRRGIHDDQAVAEHAMNRFCERQIFPWMDNYLGRKEAKAA